MKRILLAVVMMCGSAIAEQILYQVLIEDKYPLELNVTNFLNISNGAQINVPYSDWDIWRSTQTVAGVSYQDISPYFSTNEWSVYIPEGKQLQLVSSIHEPFIEQYTMGMNDYYDNNGRISSEEVTLGIPQAVYNWLWDYDEGRNTIYNSGLGTYVPFNPEGKFSAWYIRFESSTNLYPIINDEYLNTGVDYFSEGLKFNRDAIIGPAYLINRNLVTPHQLRATLRSPPYSSGDYFYIITYRNYIEHNMIFELSSTEQGIAQETLELLQAIASQTNNTQTTPVTISGSFTRPGTSGSESWSPESVTLAENEKIEFLRISGNHSSYNYAIITESNLLTSAVYSVSQNSDENLRTFYGPAVYIPKPTYNANKIDYVITQNSPNTETTTITNTVVNTITNTVGYTLSEVADMRVGSQMVNVSNNNAKLRFELDMSDDLTVSWQTNVHTIEVDMPVTNDVQFFRLRMD